MLDAAEGRVLECAEAFQDVARGTPLDLQWAETLLAQSAELLNEIIEIRNRIRLAGPTTGLH